MSTRIISNLLFDHQALEAASYYAKLFPAGRISNIIYYPEDGLPEFQRDLAGRPQAVEFEIGGVYMRAVNAGQECAANASMSFLVNFDPSRDPLAEENLESIWFALAFEGEVLVDLCSTFFSPRYGWVKDRYGHSWQLILTNPEGEPRPNVIPSLSFGGPQQNLAREALEHYASVFAGARLGTTIPYGQQRGPATAEALQFGEIEVYSQWFAMMDSAAPRDFSFTEAVSFQINCADQQEIDRLWAALSAFPEAESCGWCKDRFGVSWQIVPEEMEQLMALPGAYQKMLGMKKLVIADF